MSLVRCFALLMLLSLFFGQATAASDEKPVLTSPLATKKAVLASDLKPPARKSALEPEKIERIQVIGRAVLATRQGLPQTPAMKKLQQQVEELRQAIKQDTGAPQAGKAPEMLLKGVNTPAPTAQTAKAPETSPQAVVADKRENRIRTVLDKLRKQRETVEVETQERSVERDHPLERNATAKVRQLEDEVEKALQSPAEERDQKLLALRERLKIGPRLTTPGKPKTPGIRTNASQGGEQQ